MSGSLIERRRIARHQRAYAYWAVLIAWCVSIWLGTSLQPAVWVHATALFVHLASIVVGLGAALMVEYTGLLWMRGRRPVEKVREMEHTLAVPAWLGIVGLLASGALLELHMDQPRTFLKLLAVLVLALNGVSVSRLGAELDRLPDGTAYASVPARLKRWCVTSGIVSQVAWWTAVVIGMLNTTSRHGG